MVDLLVLGWYPYVAFAVFLLGGWLRFDGEPHIQPDGSGRLFSRRQMTLGVTLFHVGVLILLVGHLVSLWRRCGFWNRLKSCTVSSSRWPT